MTVMNRTGATERRFQEFKRQESIDLDKAMREVEPSQMDGFANRWADQYMERARKFLRTVHDDLKRKYDNKLFDTDRELYYSAVMFQRTEQKRSVFRWTGSTEAIRLPRNPR